MDASVGIVNIGTAFPRGVLTAADLAARTGIPEGVMREKFGIQKKHVAGPEEHVSDLAITAAQEALNGIEPSELDAVIYFGSEYKDYYVWSVAARIQHAIGARRAFAFEIMALCASGTVAFKVVRDMMLADRQLRTVLIVAASREANLLDYGNLRSRFMFNFADGAAAAILKRGWPRNRVLETVLLTDGSFSLDVYVPAGGSRLPASADTVARRQHYLDVPDPDGMKARLDAVSKENFLYVIREAVRRSGYTMDRVRFLGITHMKRSFYRAILDEVGLGWENTVYLEEFGHVQAADQLLILKLASQQKKLRDGDLVVVAGAGTGYTWGATALLWGEV